MSVLKTESYVYLRQILPSLVLKIDVSVKSLHRNNLKIK